MIETCEFQSIIYRFVDVDPEIGIDAEDLTNFLKDFNALIKEIAREASVQNRVKVRVRTPARFKRALLSLNSPFNGCRI